MDTLDSSFTGGPEILDHDLNRHFAALLAFESTGEMKASVLWGEIRVEVERILNAVVVSPSGNDDRLDFQAENHPVRPERRPPLLRKEGSQNATIRALAWNIERGNRFEGIVDALENHEGLRDKDVLLLTELDYGMARSGNRFVAREIAR